MGSKFIQVFHGLVLPSLKLWVCHKLLNTTILIKDIFYIKIPSWGQQKFSANVLLVFTKYVTNCKHTRNVITLCPLEIV